MSANRLSMWIALPIALVLAGCATVDPRPDYQTTIERISKATGHETVYRPGEEELVQEQVASLLNGGLTVGEAVQVCLLNNPILQANFLNIGMSRADVVQSGLLSNPSLGVSVRLPSGGGLANLEAGLAQNIAALWQIPVRKRVAQRNLDRAILQLAHDAAQLAADAQAQYYTAVAARRIHSISQDNLEIAEGLLEMAIARQQAGAGNELDVNLSRGTVLQAKLALRGARLAASQAARNLATLLGLDEPAEELALLDELPEPPDWEITPQRIVEVALLNRLDIQAAQHEVMAAAARLQEQWRMIFPIVELGVALERGERKAQGGRDVLADTARASIASGGLTAPGIQPRSARRRHTDLIVGPSIRLELPIFDQNQAQIAKAEMAYRQALKLLGALELAASQEVRSAADRAMTAWDIARFYRDDFLPLAQTNLGLSRESYRAGRASFLAVLEAQRFFLDARSRYVGALGDAAMALPDLERVVGLPLAQLMSGMRENPDPDPGKQTDEAHEGGRP